MSAEDEGAVRTLAGLEALYGPVETRSLDTDITYIHPHYAAFIRAAPLVVLATSGPDGRASLH